jgi:hypothetical protein
MTLYKNLETFYGLPVEDYSGPGSISFARTAPRLRCEYDEKDSMVDKLARLLDDPDIADLRVLVIGLWTDDGEVFEASPVAVIECLVSMKDRLPKLEAIFFGDIVSEENEISWIQQDDHSAIWSAFPNLRCYGARGGNGLRLGQINHGALETLIVETGGLPAGIVREALMAKAPLKHLELWLGDEGYGATSRIEDFRDLFAGKLFPQLEYLGLKNSEYTDDIARAIAGSPLLSRLKVLDLSMGTLTDRGADALISSGQIGHLERLDISHHYLSDEKIAALARSTRNLVAESQEKPDEWDGEPHYYVSVSE